MGWAPPRPSRRRFRAEAPRPPRTRCLGRNFRSGRAPLGGVRDRCRDVGRADEEAERGVRLLPGPDVRAEPVLRIDNREVVAARFVEPRALLAAHDLPPFIRAYLGEGHPDRQRPPAGA